MANGIPLVMEAKSPTLSTEWLYKAVRQFRRYQEAGPEWHGTGAPKLFYYNLLCVAERRLPLEAKPVFTAQGLSPGMLSR